MTEPKFIHLRTHTAYSLSEGAIRVGELPELCLQNKMPAVGITDSGNLFGALEISQACTKAGVQPIIGTQMQISEDGDSGKIILLAKNDKGYRNLLKIVSNSFLDGSEGVSPIIKISDLRNQTEGLIALSGGTNGLLAGYIISGKHDKAASYIEILQKLFEDNLYIEINRHGTAEDAKSEPELLKIAYENNIPLVATNNCLFPNKELFEAQDALMCIAHGRYVSEGNRPKYTQQHFFKSQDEMIELFSDIPEAIANSVVIAKRCAVMPVPHEPMLPRSPVQDGRTEVQEFEAVAREGLKERLREIKNIHSEKEIDETPYWDRLDYEMGIIIKMDFPGYFLIVSDFIRWSKDNNIPVGPGRGSGAGSVIAWAMKITDLDPLHFGLLFERFLNPERVSMPDFDIDFCQERRDEVIRYVQQKYGDDKVAQIITFGKLQARAVLRDVGRVLQMSYSQVDRMCKMIPFNPLSPVTLGQAIEMDPQLKKEAKGDESVAKLLDIGLKLEGMFRHASTHAAGVVIGSEPLTNILPLYTDHRSPIPATQYSMKYSEMAGLVKFDFLGLKTLTVIQKAVELVNEASSLNNKESINISAIPINDEATFKMLAKGDSTGVFQMESAGMRDAMRKMRIDSIEDIIALISLYRPGPMDNIPTYIARKHGREQPDYLHPKLEKLLNETYGVIIYQEQVMEIAQILAGYSLGEADLLRRAMGKKIKAEMDKQRSMFMEGAEKNKVNAKKAGEIFDLVAKFAGYGFNKSHAAAYAMIGYQTAYLKANYPVEFLTASMNIDIGDTDKLLIFREEARSSGVEIQTPDVNKSGAYFKTETREHTENKPDSLQRQRAIRYAMGALKGVSIAAMEELVKEREANGEFKDIFDLAERCGSLVMNKRQIEGLAKSGAFDSINPNRKQICESAAILIRHSQLIEEEKESQQVSLFGEAQEEASKPILPDVEDWDDTEKIAMEYEVFGFYLGNHPLDAYIKELLKIGVVPCAELEDSRMISGEGATIKIAGVVTKITQRASNTGRRFAYLQVSDPSGTTEVSLFNEELISNSRDIIDSGKPLIIVVEARKDEGGVRLTGQKIELADQYLENIGYDVHLHFLSNLSDPKKAANNLKDMLHQAGHGRAKITCHIPTANNAIVDIMLPETYRLNDKSINKIALLYGIKDVMTA